MVLKDLPEKMSSQKTRSRVGLMRLWDAVRDICFQYQYAANLSWHGCKRISLSSCWCLLHFFLVSKWISQVGFNLSMQGERAFIWLSQMISLPMTARRLCVLRAGSAKKLWCWRPRQRICLSRSHRKKDLCLEPPRCHTECVRLAMPRRGCEMWCAFVMSCFGMWGVDEKGCFAAFYISVSKVVDSRIVASWKWLS